MKVQRMEPGRRPPRLLVARAPSCLAAALVIAVLAWPSAWPGIVEGGAKAQQDPNNTFRVVVDGTAFTATSGVTARDILLNIRSQIDATAAYCAVEVDPDPNHTLNALRILRESPMGDPTCTLGPEVGTLEWFEDDPNVSGTSVEFPTMPMGQVVTVRKIADAVAANGNVTVNLTLVDGGLKAHTISTVGKTTTQVNADIASALRASGFTVVDNGASFTVSTGEDAIRKVATNHTDTGILTEGISLESSMEGTSQAVPTLSEWGLIALVLLVSLAGVGVLIGRRGGLV